MKDQSWGNLEFIIGFILFVVIIPAIASDSEWFTMLSYILLLLAPFWILLIIDNMGK